MAGLGKKTFTAGEVLTAADVNGYLMEQSVMVFGGTAARSSAVPTPSEGMISYLTDSDVTETFNGTAWASVLNPPINAQAGTAYTFTRVDASRTVTASNGSASTYTVPPQADVAWPDGATLTLRNLGAGVVTIAGGSGVTVTNTAQTVAQYGSVKIIRTGSNAWTVLPDSGGASGLTFIASSTFTSSTAVNVNNVFTSTYANYRIVVDLIATADTLLTMRLRASGADNTTANYYSVGLRVASNATTVDTYIWTQNASNFEIGSIAANESSLIIDITNPQKAKATRMTTAMAGTKAGNSINASITGAHTFNATTQFDGFTLYNGTYTGIVRVYGYQD